MDLEERTSDEPLGDRESDAAGWITALPGGPGSSAAGPSTAAVEQAAADADQTAADVDQADSDRDQAASDADQASADEDQLASDRDQAVADQDHADDHIRSAADDEAYDVSTGDRAHTTIVRFGDRLKRAGFARDRDATAASRDRTALTRDRIVRARDVHAADLTEPTTHPRSSMLRKLEALAADAAADREQAAVDRALAAADRADAARERAGLEAELLLAHLDELTGAYRRELGRLALSNEIDRARRGDGRFVIAFVDVDDLKAVNDRDGHAAGDLALQVVVDTIRARLRSFDPIVRYGGDEFVCGLSGTDIVEAESRFVEIGRALVASAHVGISVGLASLEADETADGLMARADAAMLVVKATHHSRV
jgi:diguanylate cyclase (GGDEF)-like protein